MRKPKNTVNSVAIAKTPAASPRVHLIRREASMVIATAVWLVAWFNPPPGYREDYLGGRDRDHARPPIGGGKAA